MTDYNLSLDIPDEIIAEILNFVSRYPKYSIVSKRFQNVYKQFSQIYKSPKYLRETYPYYDLDLNMVKYHMIKAALNNQFDDLLVLISTKIKRRYSVFTDIYILGVLASHALLTLYAYKDIDSNMDRIYYILGKYYNEMTESLNKYSIEFLLIEKLTTNNVHKYSSTNKRKIGYVDFGPDPISLKLTDYPWDHLTIKVPGYIDIPLPLILSHDKYFDIISKHDYYYGEYIDIVTKFATPTPLIINRIHQILKESKNRDVSIFISMVFVRPIYFELFWNTSLFTDSEKNYKISTITGILKHKNNTLDSSLVYALVVAGAIPKSYMDEIYNSV